MSQLPEALYINSAVRITWYPATLNEDIWISFPDRSELHYRNGEQGYVRFPSSRPGSSYVLYVPGNQEHQHCWGGVVGCHPEKFNIDYENPIEATYQLAEKHWDTREEETIS